MLEMERMEGERGIYREDWRLKEVNVFGRKRIINLNIILRRYWQWDGLIQRPRRPDSSKRRVRLPNRY